jgi:peptidoglycan/LPS O-acetylase OafA/YrhL
MKNLDLLRAVAVLCVFSAHLVDSLGLQNPGSLGRFGVVIFFVHTSFVLMGSLERLEKSGLTHQWRLSGAFYIRRFFRIYPLAVFIILLVPLFHIPAVPFATYSWVGSKAFLSNLALTQNLTYSSALPEGILATTMPREFSLTFPGKLPRAWGLSLVLALVIAYVRDGALKAIQPLAHWIAEHSYGIYLSHIVIFWFALNVMRFSSPWLKFSIIAAASAGIPVLLYQFLEKPLIGVGVRLAKPTRPVAYAVQIL